MAAPARFDGARSRAGDNADGFDDWHLEEIECLKAASESASRSWNSRTCCVIPAPPDPGVAQLRERVGELRPFAVMMGRQHAAIREGMKNGDDYVEDCRPQGCGAHAVVDSRRRATAHISAKIAAIAAKAL